MTDQIAAMEKLLGQLEEVAATLAVFGTEESHERLSGRLRDAGSRLSNDRSKLSNKLASFKLTLAAQSFCSRDQWMELDALKKESRSFAADYLALYQSASFRRGVSIKGLPGTVSTEDVCRAADVLVETMMEKLGEPRSNFVVISESERFGVLSSAIHLAWSRLTLWNLNRALHETAHLWGEEYANASQGVQRLFVNSLRDRLPTWNELIFKEIFADAVATYVGGPGYVFSCLFLDFNPAERLPTSTSTHPSSDVRAQCMLIVLEEMSLKFQNNPSTRIIGKLGKFWQNSRIAADLLPSSEGLDHLKTNLEDLLMRLKDSFPNAQYGPLSRAIAASNRLVDKSKPLLQNVDAFDIFNGAWLARLKDRSLADRVENEALSMLLQEDHG